jgi:hypothetical protein
MFQLPQSIDERIKALCAAQTQAITTKKVAALPALSLVLCNNVVVALSQSEQVDAVIDALCAPNSTLASRALYDGRAEDAAQGAERVLAEVVNVCSVVSDCDAVKILEATFPCWVTYTIDMADSKECDHHIVVNRRLGVATGAPVGCGVTFPSASVTKVDLTKPPTVKTPVDRLLATLRERCPPTHHQGIHITLASSWKTDVDAATAAAANIVQTGPSIVPAASEAAGVACAMDTLRTLAAMEQKSLKSAAKSHVVWPHETLLPVSVLSSHEPSRRALHKALCLPNKPRLTSSQAVSDLGNLSWSMRTAQSSSSPQVPRHGAAWERNLVATPHATVSKPLVIEGSTTALVEGDYDYYHYKIDGFNDDGWGCAYRSLQSVISWFQYQGLTSHCVPSVTEIQKILARVDYGKESQKNFVGSREWIGSYEVMMVLTDLVPQLECTLKRLESGAQLAQDIELQRTLVQHFQSGGPPVMIGGSSYAHTIVGIDVNVRSGEVQYLILDPHYSSNATDMKIVKSKGWCAWKNPSKFFEAKAFYNLCIPRVQYADFS